jgi:hypothetical protein
LEHIAVGHHRLAIETGQRGNVRMRSRGDNHDVGRRVEHVGVAGVIGSFFTVAEVAKIITF